MPISSASEAFGFGFDLGKVLSALFDAQIGSDDFTFAFKLTFTLSLDTTESSESCQLKLDCVSYILVVIGFTEVGKRIQGCGLKLINVVLKFVCKSRDIGVLLGQFSGRLLDSSKQTCVWRIFLIPSSNSPSAPSSMLSQSG